jgi:hypothetical protein
MTAAFLQSGIRSLNAKTVAGGDYSKREVALRTGNGITGDWQMLETGVTADITPQAL